MNPQGAAPEGGAALPDGEPPGGRRNDRAFGRFGPGHDWVSPPIFERLGRYDDALRVGYQAFERDPYDLQTLHNLAVAHYRKLELDRLRPPGFGD